MQTQTPQSHGRTQAPLIEIDLSQTHAGCVAREVLAVFDSGRFVAGTVILLPLRYRIIHNGQTRPELYSQAIEAAASAQACALTRGRS